MKKEEKELVKKAFNCNDLEAAKEYLKQLMYLSERKTSAKIDIFEFVAKDFARPVLNYVCYDNEHKVAVASDGHVLCVSKSDFVDYSESGFRKCKQQRCKRTCYLIDKKGKPNENDSMTYPNYESIFPKRTNCTEYTVDCKKLRDCVKKCKGEEKLDHERRFIKINHQYFDVKTASLISKFSGGVWYALNETSALVYEDDNYRCLFMPYSTTERAKIVVDYDCSNV